MDDDHQRYYSERLATFLQHLYAAERRHARISRHRQFAAVADRLVTRHSDRSFLRSHWAQAGAYHQHYIFEFFLPGAGDIQTASAHPHHVWAHRHLQYVSHRERLTAHDETFKPQ